MVLSFYNSSLLLKRFFLPVFFYSSFQTYGQSPFLEIRPYAVPSFGQYSIKASIDHHLPLANVTDGVFKRFDGDSLFENLIFPNCTQGVSCYDGHAGVDYHMPANTPILAPAPGYVLWSSFSPGADPCPGGISPNGDTGIIILAHGNDYFSCYLHLNPPLNVSVGENVETGDTLGFNGNTGCAINPHLHFEIRKGSWTYNEQQPYAIDPFGWWGNEPDPIAQIRDNYSAWLWKSNNLVDDNDNGFQRFYGPDWDYIQNGYNGDSWVAPPVNNIDESQHWAIWVPELSDSGLYNIEVFIPSGLDATDNAIYEIVVLNNEGGSEKTLVFHNQGIHTDSFFSIATLHLPKGTKSAIILRDLVGESASGSFVVFDAIRFTNSTTSSTKENVHPKTFLKPFSYPNPFNPTANIVFSLNETTPVKFYIYSISGEKINSYDLGIMTPGKHIKTWQSRNINGDIVPSGVYLFTIETNKKRASGKMVLLR